MSKVRNVQGGGQIFFCPGCDHVHQVNTAKNGPRWFYNENPDAPTFQPSILVRSGHHADGTHPAYGGIEEHP